MSISTELSYLKESDITTEDLDPRIQVNKYRTFQLI